MKPALLACCNLNLSSSTPLFLPQVLATMFVWVLLEGLLQAVQQMEAAGLALLQQQADAELGSSSSSEEAAVADAEAQPVAQQAQKQQQQRVRGRSSAAEQSVAALKELGKAVAMLPVLHNLAAIVGIAFTGAYKALTCSCCGASGSRHVSNLAAQNKQQQQQQQKRKPPWLSFARARAFAAAPATAWLWLARHRDAAAAFKFWLFLSLLMVLVLLLSAGAGGGVQPLVVHGVQAVPTHGVIAFVLDWHERTESTLIRVRRLAGL
jgi:hypothetical protein